VKYCAGSALGKNRRKFKRVIANKGSNLLQEISTRDP